MLCVLLSASRKGAREIHEEGLGEGGGESVGGCAGEHQCPWLTLYYRQYLVIWDRAQTCQSWVTVLSVATNLWINFITCLWQQVYHKDSFHHQLQLWLKVTLLLVSIGFFTVMQYIIQNNKNHSNHIPKTPLAFLEYDTVTGWGRKFDLQVLSQCGST